MANEHENRGKEHGDRLPCFGYESWLLSGEHAMRVPLPRVRVPPQVSTPEETHSARSAHVMLFRAIVGRTATGCANLASGWTVEAASLLPLAFVAAARFFLNHRGHVGIAPVILCRSLFLVVGMQVYHEAGPRDSAIRDRRA